MSEIKIKKAKLTRELTLELVFHKPGAKAAEAHEEIAHPDLIAAFKKLYIHFGLMSYVIPFKSIKDVNAIDEKLVEDIHVSSYSIGGPDDNQGINISGTKILPNGKALNLTTPFETLEKTDNSYRYLDDLLKVIRQIETEIGLYLDGKHAPDPQQTLFPPDENEEVEDHTDEIESNLRSAKFRTPRGAKLTAADPDAMERVSGLNSKKKKAGRKSKVESE